MKMYIFEQYLQPKFAENVQYLSCGIYGSHIEHLGCHGNSRYRCICIKAQSTKMLQRFHFQGNFLFEGNFPPKTEFQGRKRNQGNLRKFKEI